LASLIGITARRKCPIFTTIYAYCANATGQGGVK
jgi:hypothetical protein